MALIPIMVAIAQGLYITKLSSIMSTLCVSIHSKIKEPWTLEWSNISSPCRHRILQNSISCRSVVPCAFELRDHWPEGNKVLIARAIL